MPARTMTKTEYHDLKQRIRDTMRGRQVYAKRLAFELGVSKHYIHSALTNGGSSAPGLLQRMAAHLGIT